MAANQKPLLSPDQSRAFLQKNGVELSRKTIYNRISDSTFDSMRVGRKIFVRRESLERLIEGGNT
jgi:hypothetical protein